MALTLGEAGRRGATSELNDRYPRTPLGARLQIEEWRLVGGLRVAPHEGVRPGVSWRCGSCSFAAEGGSSTALRNLSRLPLALRVVALRTDLCRG